MESSSPENIAVLRKGPAKGDHESIRHTRVGQDTPNQGAFEDARDGDACQSLEAGPNPYE